MVILCKNFWLFLAYQSHHTLSDASKRSLNYIDDLIGIGLPVKLKKSFQDQCDLLQELGFAISSKKLTLPSMCVACLGVVIDTRHDTIYVSTVKN